MSTKRLYNSLLDSEQYHVDDTTVIGEGTHVPIQVNRDGIMFGGHPSTALNAVNYITVDYEAAARRNLADTDRRIAQRLEREKKQAEKEGLTAVV